MATNEIVILGILIPNREQAARQVQAILTENGCAINTRLGLHESGTDLCSPSGLIILELTGEKQDQEKLEKDLDGLEGVHLRKMEF